MEPTWTDIIQAIAAIIAVPGAIAAFVVLFIKDKGKQEQINKLSSIAEKMEIQNGILEEANVLTSKQVDALIKLTEGGQASDTSELVELERKKTELEFRPRLFSNAFGTVQNSASFQIENAGKEVVIKSIVSQDKNIIIVNPIPSEGIPLHENGLFQLSTRTKNNQVMNGLNYNIQIICEDQLGIQYEIMLNSQRMDSLRTAKKIEE